MDETWHRHNAAYWMSKRALQLAFLSFFVLFLVVGVALTILGFLDYGGQNGPMSRAFRILGVVALLLCIGFLIAACVIVSECITSSIKHGVPSDPEDCDNTYTYRLMCPTSMDTIAASDHDRTLSTSTSAFSTVIQNPRFLSHDADKTGAPLGLCPSCSCQLIARPVAVRADTISQSVSYPIGIVQFQKDTDSATIHLGNNQILSDQALPNTAVPGPPSFSSDSSYLSDGEERMETSPRHWV